MRNPRTLLAILAILLSTPVAAQDMGGGMGGGAPAGGMGGPSGGAMGGGSSLSQGALTGSQGGGARASGGGGSMSSSPDALFGLRPSASPEVITLEQALTLAATQSFDLRIAREKVVQQEQQVRKAWALLLPQVNAGASYTFNCTGLREDAFLDCSDQTVEFVTEEQLDQQKLLYGSLGEILSQVSEFEQDPAKQEELRRQSQQLFATADGFDRAKADLEPIVIQPAHVFGGNITVSMPLFNGRALPLLQNAYTAVDAVELAGDQARAALLLAVARAYYSSFTAKKMLAIAAEQRESATRHRDAVKERVALDAAAPLALRRAELDVIRAEQSVRSSEAAFRLATGALGSLLGLTESFDVIEPPPQVAIEAEGGAEELLRRAYSSRHDLRAQKLALTIADRNRMDAWMQFLPSVNLVGRASATSNSQGFVSSPVSGALMVQATIPIYDGGTRYASLKESASKIREELLKVRQMEQKIEGQVRGNLDDLVLKQQALDLAREGVKVAEETRDQAQTLYEVGAATPLDVSDANLAVYVAELDLLRAELEVQQARLGLAYVVGVFPGDLRAAARPLDEEEAALARGRVEALEGP